MADITFVPTLAGFLFLAVVMDAWSRRIVGWAFSGDLKTRVVLDALDMALAARKPENVIHHSDQGSQYTSLAFGNRCKDAGVRPSTGSVGDAYDNAMCESFFATLECELLDRNRFRSHSEARMAFFSFIEGFYNPSRRHSALGYLSPVEYERLHNELTCPAIAVNSPRKRVKSSLIAPFERINGATVWRAPFDFVMAPDMAAPIVRGHSSEAAITAGKEGECPAR